MSPLNLVTGGSGFVGNRLVEVLAARGERVRSLDIVPPAEGRSPADFRRGSVTDADAVAAATEGVDCVFHLAAVTALWSPSRASYAKVNVGGTQRVVEACRQAGVARLVHVSSYVTLVAGARHPRTVLSEADVLPPQRMLGPYPRSKRVAEALVLAARDLDAVIALPSAPIGPGDRSMTAPTRLIADLALGRLPAMMPCPLNLVPVDDLVDGLIRARDAGRAGERYLLTGDDISACDLARRVGGIAGTAPPRWNVPYGPALAASAVDEWIVSSLTRSAPRAPLTGVRLAGRERAFDGAKARDELGFRTCGLDGALREAVEWVLVNRTDARSRPARAQPPPPLETQRA